MGYCHINWNLPVDSLPNSRNATTIYTRATATAHADHFARDLYKCDGRPATGRTGESKQEEQAVLKALPLVDATLATLLGKASTPLTPKETFFCIMEYYGKNDRQKARSFCCSEQAIRSTKSRLNKKIDLSILHSSF